MFLTVVIFIFILGLLIFAHELGHFILAKRAGVRVEEFAFGFPPRIWSKKKKETTYSINLIPLGGFVRLFGEDGSDSENKKSFAAKSVFTRFKIIIAGVVFNLVLAFFIFMVYFSLQGPTITVDPIKYAQKDKINSQVMIMETVPGSVAASLDLKPGDIIEAINGKKIQLSNEVSEIVASRPNKKTSFTFRREGEEKTEIVVLGEKDGKGFLGVSMFDNVSQAAYPWYLIPYLALRDTGGVFVLIVKFIFVFLRDLVTEGKAPTEAGVGPIGIFILTKEFIKLGFVSLLRFIALLSINLSLINILPFPALDGGRILFLAIEKFRGGKKLKPKIEAAIHMVGFFIIILLIVLITYKDVLRFIVNKQ